MVAAGVLRKWGIVSFNMCFRKQLWVKKVKQWQKSKAGRALNVKKRGRPKKGRAVQRGGAGGPAGEKLVEVKRCGSGQTQRDCRSVWHLEVWEGGMNMVGGRSGCGLCLFDSGCRQFGGQCGILSHGHCQLSSAAGCRLCSAVFLVQRALGVTRREKRTRSVELGVTDASGRCWGHNYDCKEEIPVCQNTFGEIWKWFKVPRFFF